MSRRSWGSFAAAGFHEKESLDSYFVFHSRPRSSKTLIIHHTTVKSQVDCRVRIRRDMYETLGVGMDFFPPTFNVLRGG